LKWYTAKVFVRSRSILLAALALHGVLRLLLVAQGRFFASEDDPYRLYVAYLLSQDHSQLIGRFWLPGPQALVALVSSCGLSLPWAGIAVATAGLAGLAWGLHLLLRALDDRGSQTTADFAVALLLLSPLTLTLSHSALSELPTFALVVGAAAGLARHHRHGQSRPPLWAGTTALLVATWFRYEAWLLLPAYVAAATWLALRRQGRRAALIDGSIAAASALGPLAWLAAQKLRYGNPFLFLEQTQAIADALGGSATSWTVASSHALALLTWSWPCLVAASYALSRPGGHRRTTSWFALWLSLPLVAQVIAHQQHPVFPDRLVFPVELGCIPLAAWTFTSGWHQPQQSPGKRPTRNWALYLALAGWLVCGIHAVSTSRRPPALEDVSSVEFGHELRRGHHVEAMGEGSLLVERPVQRPPFGWASVGVLWETWDRTLWATPTDGRWEIVSPVNPKRHRVELTPQQLGSFLRQARVDSAWTTTKEGAALLRQAWPEADVGRRGQGLFWHHPLPEAPTASPATP
jgi:hypothetical protein